MRLLATLFVPLALKNLRAVSIYSIATTNQVAMSSSNSNEAPRIIHCNHAGASPSPSSVLDTIWKHLQLEQTVGGYTAAEMATDQLQTLYERVAQLLHSNNPRNDQSVSTSQDPTHDIALVESATVGWTRLFYSMAQYQHQRRRRQNLPYNQEEQAIPGTMDRRSPLIILVSEAEYAANVVAACHWAKDHQQAVSSSDPTWTVLSLPSTRIKNGKSTGKVDLAVLEQIFQGTYQYQASTSHDDNQETAVAATLDPSNIAMVCVTHIPTNAGLVNDVEGIGRLIANYNSQQEQSTISNSNNEDDAMPSILYLVDACQSIGQRQINVHQIQCHGLVATGRKFLRAPRGTGFLYVPHRVADHLLPHHIDHFGVPIVAVPPRNSITSRDNKASVLRRVEDLIQIRPKAGASRFEFYESNIASKLGLSEALLYSASIGMDVIQCTNANLAQDLYQRLKAMEEVQLHHPPECGIVTFYVPSVPSKTIKQALWEDSTGGLKLGFRVQFETSVVPATSTPLDSSQTSVPDLVRISLTYTNTAEDLDLLCKKLKSILGNV